MSIQSPIFCFPAVPLGGPMIGRPECQAPHQSGCCPRDIAPPGLLNIGMWRDWGSAEGSFRPLRDPSALPGTASSPYSTN